MEKNIQISGKEKSNNLEWQDMQEYFNAGKVGFWKLELESGKKRMYADSNMKALVGLPDGLSPEECYSFYCSHIHPEDQWLMTSYREKTKEGETVVEYRYLHPSEGEKHLRCSGRMTGLQDNCIRVMGYEQELSDIIYVGREGQRTDQLLRQNRDLEQKQLRTDDYYKNLMDLVNCGIISYTVPDHRLLHMNAEALRICGVKDIQEAQSHMVEIWKNVFYPNTDALAKLKNLYHGEGVVDYECTIKNLSGQAINVLARSEVFSSPQAERCVVTTFLDISESVVLKNEKDILEILCSDYTGVYLCNLNTDNVVPVTPVSLEEEKRGEQIIGAGMHSFSFRMKYAYEHMIVQESAPDFFEKLNADYLMDYLSKHNRFAYRLRIKPGFSEYEYYEIQIVWLKNADGFQVIMGFHYMDDVIRQQELQKTQLENALAVTRRKNSVIEAISRLYWQVFMVNLQTGTYKEVFTNGTYAMDHPRYEGSAYQDFTRAVDQFAKEEDKVQLRAFLDLRTIPERLSQNGSVSIEYQAKKGFWVSSSFVVQSRDEIGNIKEVLYVLQRIDEQKQRELEYQKKLEETANEARRANEAKTNFLRRMSHDIRTPLNGIVGLLKIDEVHFNDLELVKENHKKMEISAKHLLSLINDILQTSKLEDGKVQLTHEIIPLTELTQDIVNIIIGRATEAGIVWDYEKGKANIPYPYIYGSPVHLRQIFLNIYGNCIKYNRPGGKITTIVDTLPEHDGICTYRWIISDTGIGMSEEFLKHIFDPFAQENTDARSTYQGIGLGMFIVKGLIDQMGGTIQITSKEGIGSTFEVILPFEIAPAPEEKASELPEPENALNGLHLMLVEDNELNAEIAKVLLMDAGANVTVVADGKQAVDLFASGASGTFDAILMDIMMPVMDGLTATKAIRTSGRPDAETIPIIAMTANAFKEDEIKCLAVGMNAHLAKPLDIEKVKKTIQEQINRKK